jgi:hypothetical protein
MFSGLVGSEDTKSSEAVIGKVCLQLARHCHIATLPNIHVSFEMETSNPKKIV